MPPRPQIDLAKLRSKISRLVDDSFPVFSRPVWHARHACREASFGMPSMTDFGVRSSTTS